MIDKNHNLWNLLSQNSVPNSKQKWIDLAQTKIQEPFNQSVILLGQQLAPQKVLQLFIEHNAFHLVQQNKDFLDQDVRFASLLAHEPKKYFDKKFSEFFSDIQKKSSFSFSRENEKEALVREMESFLDASDPLSLKESARAILEELYMNALLSAPREAAKQKLKNQNFEDGRKAQMHFVRTKDKFLISCEDPFGALDPKKLLARMHQVYLHGAGTAINLEKEGGAGLGCVIMFEHSSDLILGVIPGQMTLVTCLIPVNLNYKKKESLSKALHRVELSA